MTAALTGGVGVFDATPAAAADSTIQGTVVDSGGTHRPDVVVEALNVGTTSVVSSTTTIGDGSFTLTVAPGPYDLRFTPPEGSGLRIYLATGINADDPASLTIVLRPITIVTIDGVVRNSQGTAYPSASVWFTPTSGPTTNRNANSSGQYSVDLLAGQYQVGVSTALSLNGGNMYSSLSFAGQVELDQSQTYDVTVPTKVLTVSVLDVNGAPVTDAAIRYDYTSISNPAYSGATYLGGTVRVDAQGNVTFPVVTGSTLVNPAIVLDSGLVIPFTIPTMTTDRRLYMIFDRVTGSIFIDETPPIVIGTPDRAANARGWYKAPVTIGWASTDPVPSSGVPTTPPTTVVSTEGLNQVVTSAESCDPAGNCATGQYTVSIDQVAPRIEYSVSPAANNHGWHKGDVTVSFICSDALSGVTSCPEPVTVSADNANLAVNGTAVDNAGNTASVTATVRLDRTAPTITAALSQETGGTGWNNGDVTVTFTCTDEMSGIDSCSGPVTLTEDGPDQVVTGTAVDRAGNVSITTVTVSIDSSKPLIIAERTPANGHGWNNNGVTVTFTCADAQSGVATCPDPITVTDEGAGQTVSGTATNNAGNSAVATVDDINIDRTAPALTATVLGDENAAGWYGIPPTVQFTCSDQLSGIDLCPDDLVVVTEGGNQSITASATDRAANVASVTIAGLDIDLTAPVVTVAGVVQGAMYPLDETPSVVCATTDATSGVATQATLTITRDSSGLHTATCAGAIDVASNTAPPRSATYTVTPTATSLGDITTDYVSASGSPSARGVIEDLEHKLLHGQMCLFIEKVNREASGPNPTLTAAQAAELVYWARILDPAC
jgi:hypothetical protein